MNAPIVQSRFRVTGMDCASCAAKIDGAARRITGVTDVSVSVTAGTMTLHHEPETDIAKLEQRLGTLGYAIAPIAPQGGAAHPAQKAHAHCAGLDHHDDHGDSHDAHPGDACCGSHAPAHGPATSTATEDNHSRAPMDGPWWRSAKARLTLLSGLALGAAFGAGLLLPRLDTPLFILAMLVGLAPIARRAFAAAVDGMPFTIEMLMTIAAVGAVAIGAAEEAAAVVFLFLVGELLEGVAAGRARASISALSDLVPKTAWVEHDGAVRAVSADSLAVGATILVRPGDRIPADGIIIAGDSAIDEAPVTGESTPVRKGVDAVVFAGTVNGEAALRVQVTATASDNTIARVVRLVEEAQEKKAPTERFIDQFARYYTPAVLAVGALVAVVPPLAFGAPWAEWVYKGLAILLIGCPCALVISTPAAIAAGLSAGARRGLLMKGGAVLETFRKVTTVCFDKTGTLTAGKPEVTDIMALALPAGEVLRLAAAVETGSSHPLARAIVAHAAAQAIAVPPAEDARAHGGKGVTARVEGRVVFLGAPAAAAELVPVSEADMQHVAALNADGKTVSLLVVERTLAGAIALRDEPRPDAAAAIKALTAAHITTLMLTGDNRRTADAIGARLGIAVAAELLPADKQRVVSDLKARGAMVAKVGDGINDAPALASADIGIAMGDGTDVALETADAAALHARVQDIPDMIALSRRTMGNIHQNITIALGLKAVFLVTTVAGITGLWPAILADTGATVLVTLNALRLLRFRPQ
ncbi:heavy metal translocating P-type ATPase [Xanthobacter agilis]|uniref:P-type Zn(2+) transporter n=1 Tax=Xanthobacter agilis TaxID=47492 RepID=A0ABU0LHZ9_XANAG|nr:heavy metal translocating P-type ATPase [Xanthobacter agilis]MDQ0506715.1 Cd2+/Zn2+-exporting ATPase [Xanthobacter agilis]